MMSLVEGSLHYIRHNSRQHLRDDVPHHHGEAAHLTYLERPFVQAREAIHRRMHRVGIPH